MTRTASGSRMVLNLALNYGGRDEILRAARALVRDGLKPDHRSPGKTSRSGFYTAGQPDPGFIDSHQRRKRLSNFLLLAMRLQRALFYPGAMARF